STQESILLSQHAQSKGADGVLTVNPYYWSLPQKNLIEHYKNIADSIDIPILLYNFPNLTGQDLSAELVLELVKNNPNIIGIKETIDSIEHIRDMLTKVKEENPDFLVFVGTDDHLLNTLQMGGDGAIPATANFAPEITVGIYNLYKKRDFNKIEELQHKLMRLLEIYKLSTPLIGAVKEAIKVKGLNISTQVLPPAQDLSEESKSKVKEILKSLSI